MGDRSEQTMLPAQRPARKFRCDVCDGRSFRYYFALEQHVADKHGPKNEEANISGAPSADRTEQSYLADTNVVAPVVPAVPAVTLTSAAEVVLPKLSDVEQPEISRGSYAAAVAGTLLPRPEKPPPAPVVVAEPEEEIVSFEDLLIEVQASQHFISVVKHANLERPSSSIACSWLSDEEQAKAIQWLRAKCHGGLVLVGAGYNFHPLSPEQLADAVKCVHCEQRKYLVDGTRISCSPWETHKFPGVSGGKLKNTKSEWTVPKDPSRQKALAVALDCEMVSLAGGGAGNWNDLVKVTVVDFLTGEVLVNAFVEPSGRVINWLTWITGLSPRSFDKARKAGKVLSGCRGARDVVWRFIDDKTIIVGHALRGDLEALGMRHSMVVDTAILVSGMMGLGRGKTCGLKDLCSELLNLHIQDGTHSPQDDALAAREVALSFMRDPEKAQRWANERRKRYGGR